MQSTMESDVMEENKLVRALRVTLRLLALGLAMAGVFVVSFLITLSMKTDNPGEVLRIMFSTKSQVNAPTPKPKPKVEEKISDEPKEEPPSDEKTEPEEESEPEEEHSIDPKWAQKLERLKSIRAAVDEKIQNREHYVPLEEIPRSLRQAIVAVEDSRFYSHKGFDPEGIARATVVNVEAGQIEEGGSTITQQLVKNLFLSQEQSFTRKLEEIFLAIKIEKNFTKDEILELYLNTIYFGSGFYGVYDASMGYFGKEPWELTLAESTMLAGLPQAPSVYSPYVDFMAAKKRQLTVIQAMVRAKVLTEREAERARVDSIYLVEDAGGYMSND